MVKIDKNDCEPFHNMLLCKPLSEFKKANENRSCIGNVMWNGSVSEILEHCVVSEQSKVEDTYIRTEAGNYFF